MALVPRLARCDRRDGAFTRPIDCGISAQYREMIPELPKTGLHSSRRSEFRRVYSTECRMPADTEFMEDSRSANIGRRCYAAIRCSLISGSLLNFR